MLAEEHPQGTTTIVGCQVRYLISSAHGWLGAVGFSASALRLHARDTWMGWNDKQRTAHLHRVVCLSRFLIRPAVQCRHLASHVLGRVLRRVGADFEARYHYRPWLVETFVEHDGACFRAANFACVGPTAGRGRCDRAHDGPRTVNRPSRCGRYTCARPPPPEGEKPLEWFLLTSVRVESIEAALETIGHYLRRWRMEDFFRVLKSGCRAEHLGFHSAERLQRALTIQAVIAWRLMLMTLLGREVPECDAELLFSEIELRFLADYAADSGLSAPDTLAGAVLLVVLLGGYQNRKHDPPPGHQIT